ncbi:MAG: undecaprenyl-diphosphate phosphatase [Deltaproteobacteria bacterium]|nr:MAG: undecaprenyl-diphosphate phosphatase [Deltaproteobacteria bacterium]
MSPIDAVVLGVVQGLTEFLPVSSSGHLVVFEALLGAQQSGVAFEVVVHGGTLLAVLLVYGRDIGRILRDTARALPMLLRGDGRGAYALEDFRLGLLLLVGTVPTAAIGLLLEDTFKALFSSLSAVGVAFLVTGALLHLADRVTRRAEARIRPLSPGRALAIGVAQGAAITPGISRSGSTIATALLLGIDRVRAAQYSFLLSVPAILGAMILELRHGLPPVAGGLLPYALGFVAAALSGFGALRVLLRLVRLGRLGVFAWYLWPLGLGVLAWAQLH